MDTILKVNINDFNSQFFHDIGQKITSATEIEIRIPQKKRGKSLFSDEQFWQVIQVFDWSKQESGEILKPAIAVLAAMPIVNIYLFADILAEKLFQLDTKQHGAAYLANEGDEYLSVDDFLYVRCAVVAEGKEYYEGVLADPTKFPDGLTFEPLLNLANKAYQAKTGRPFDYHAPVSYETYSNKAAWN